MDGMIFDIQHFCVDDGPGIRTTVFMKGCPLHCAWCHNPEGISRQLQISYRKDACAACGRCVEACPQSCHQRKQESNLYNHLYYRSNCSVCGKCVEACPAEALKVMGRTATVEEVLRDVLKDKLFYDTSDGGITLSGGEPFFQSAFAIELLKAAKQAGLHTCVETSGYTSESVIREAAEYTDLFLLDMKETDPLLHKQFTGVDNEVILHNAKVLSELKKDIILRCPIIPGYNDREEHFAGIAHLANALETVREIHIEPYHPFGVDKYYELGLKPIYENREFMDTKRAEEIAQQIKEYTEKKVIVA